VTKKTRKGKHISKNTFKQLEKMQGEQALEGLKFDTFKALNKVWKQYIATLLGKDEPTNPAHNASICSKVTKAELAGAEVVVSNSKNKTMIGVSGIVVKESQRCLYVINTQNEVKCLIKPGTVFEVKMPLEGYSVRLWGDNIVYVGSERTKVRFKEKYNLDLY